MSSVRKHQGRDGESVSRSTRISRIAMPIKRSLYRTSERRSNSVDHGNSNSAFLSSGSKRARSATPMRTPTRASAINANVGFTSEKKKAPIDDKKWIQCQTNRIMNYLKNLDGLGKDFINRGGLRSMSVKEFVFIVSHLIKFIVPRFCVKVNYVDDIYQILLKIDYPFSINKSWLKTPNVPHTLNHVIVLLNWLLDFVPCDADGGQHEFESEENIINCKDLPNKAYTSWYSNMVKEGFSFWNNNQDNEFQCLQDKLIDEYINQKTSNRSSKELKMDCKMLTKEYEELYKKKVIISNENEFNDLKKEIEQKRNELEQISSNFCDKQLQLDRLKEQESDLTTNLTELQSIEAEILIELKTQKAENKEKKQMNLITELNVKKLKFASKLQSIEALQQLGFENQIHYSRLLKRKFEIVTKFNILIHQISLELNYDLNHLNIDPEYDCNEKEISKISSELEGLQRECQIIYKTNLMKAEKFEIDIKAIKQKNELVLSDELKQQEDTYKSLLSQVEQIDISLIKMEKENKKTVNDIEKSIAECKGENQKLQMELTKKLQQFKEAQEAAKAFVESADKRINNLLKEKEERIMRDRQLVQKMKELLDKVDL